MMVQNGAVWVEVGHIPMFSHFPIVLQSPPNPIFHASRPFQLCQVPVFSNV